MDGRIIYLRVLIVTDYLVETKVQNLNDLQSRFVMVNFLFLLSLVVTFSSPRLFIVLY